MPKRVASQRRLGLEHKKCKNVGWERQLDSGTDWPVRPQMQVVAPLSTLLAQVFVCFHFYGTSPANVRDSEPIELE